MGKQLLKIFRTTSRIGNAILMGAIDETKRTHANMWEEKGFRNKFTAGAKAYFAPLTGAIRGAGKAWEIIKATPP
jgi:hypothetical protein